jgi:hypothetical protein
MASYKVLKSVAHNVGHSFVSLMNYADDDYVMGHVLRFSRLTGHDCLTINLMTGEAAPPELLRAPVSEVPARYSKWFWDLVERQGSDRAYVRSATLNLRYDIATQRPVARNPEFVESPYVCNVRVTDSRGKEYVAHFDGWWYPERQSKQKNRRWWELWTWFSAR